MVRGRIHASTVTVFASRKLVLLGTTTRSLIPSKSRCPLTVATPVDTTSETLVPGATLTPPPGSCEITRPAGTVSLLALLTPPTARPAVLSSASAADCVSPVTSGTTICEGPEPCRDGSALSLPLLAPRVPWLPLGPASNAAWPEASSNRQYPASPVAPPLSGAALARFWISAALSARLHTATVSMPPSSPRMPSSLLPITSGVVPSAIVPLRLRLATRLPFTYSTKLEPLYVPAT